MATLPQAEPQSFRRRLSIRDLSDNRAVTGKVESQNGSPHVAIKLSRSLQSTDFPMKKRRAQGEPYTGRSMSIKPRSTPSPTLQRTEDFDEGRSSIDSKRQRVSIDEVFGSSASTSPSQVKVFGQEFGVGSLVPIHSGTLAALMEQEIDVVFDNPSSPSSSASLETDLSPATDPVSSFMLQEGEDESDFLAFLDTLKVSGPSSFPAGEATDIPGSDAGVELENLESIDFDISLNSFSKPSLVSAESSVTTNTTTARSTKFPFRAKQQPQSKG